jgi:hypothetical protein
VLSVLTIDLLNSGSHNNSVFAENV